MPRPAKYDKVKQMQAGEIATAEIAANAVNYAKLDATGRKYVIRFRRAASDTAGTDFELPAGIAQFAGTVTSVKVVGDSGIGQATNYSTLAVVNKGGTAGDGTTSIASYDFDNGTTHALTTFVPKALTLSGTGANLVVASGDVLTVKKTHTSSGQALPTNLFVEIVIERSA